MARSLALVEGFRVPGRVNVKLYFSNLDPALVTFTRVAAVNQRHLRITDGFGSLIHSPYALPRRVDFSIWL